MNPKTFIFLFSVISILLITAPSEAFEESFQYYPGGVISPTWYTDGFAGSGSYSCSIVTSGATYSRSLQLYAEGSNYINPTYVTCHSNVTTASNYWSFIVRSKETTSPGGTDINLIFYNYDYSVIKTISIKSGGYAIGFWEVTRQSSGDTYLRINGTDQGFIGNVASIPYTIGFYVYTLGVPPGTTTYHSKLIVDEITTSGYISGIGTESTSHTLTESNLNSTNISYTVNTFPFSDYTASSFVNSIEKYTGATPGAVISTTVKNATQTGVYSGFSNYNRKSQITTNDINYGLYFSYLKKDGTVVATDYFFLVPTGSTDSITTADTSAVIGQEESISYVIGAPDFGGSSYSVNVYSLTALVTSIPIATGMSSGTVTWDTSGNSPGLYFITLSKTTSGVQTDLAYTTITLVSTLLIRGNVYNAVNATGISGASISFLQGSTWYNTTSNATGNYNLSGLTAGIVVNINATKSGYTHNNYSFNPVAPQIYTINLYMIPNSYNCSIAAGGGSSTNTCIIGIVENDPYHQAVPGATVYLSNGTYSTSTTSNTTTGFYSFLNLSDDNLPYDVNATKTGYRNSSTYNVTTINQTFKTQIILMSEIYTLTIQAQDSTNANTLLDFSLLFNLQSYNTTVGQITITNLTYGQYPAIVSATNYISSSQTILVDSTKTVTFYLSPVLPVTGSTLFKTIPHDVMFIVQDLSFNKKSGIYVTATGYNTTVGSWTWLAELLGIDFGTIPINNATMSGITGTDGAIDFKMDGSIYYIVTFSGTGISNMTWQGYPTQYQYVIIVPTTQYGTFIGNIDEIESITTLVSTQTINASTAKIYANYSDSTNLTTNVTVYLNKSIPGDPNNQTNIQTVYSTTNPTFNSTFNISPHSGQNYIITFVFTHSTLGTKVRSYGVSFPISSPISYFNPISVIMLIVGLILFFAGFWGQTSTEQGAAVIVGLVWLLSGMGLYASINLGINFYLGLTLATVITILMNVNARARKEGMS